MEIVNYFKGNCESLTPTKGKGNLIDKGLRNSHWQRPGEVSPTGQGFWRMLFYQDLAVTLYTQCFVLESWLFFFCHQPLLPVPTPSRQTSQSYRAIHSQTFLSPLHWAHCPKNTQKKKPCPKHWEFQGTLSLNPNYTSRLFWHGGGFVLLHCAHLTISNRHLCLLLSWRSPGSLLLGNVLFHPDWLRWQEQTIFKKIPGCVRNSLGRASSAEESFIMGWAPGSDSSGIQPGPAPR